MTTNTTLEAWVTTEVPRLLPGFLPARRWFGGKARPIEVVTIEDAVWLADPGGSCALMVIGVRYTAGPAERYTLLLAVVDEPADLPVIGRFEQAGRTRWAVEASADPAAALTLLQEFAAPEVRPTTRGGRLRVADVGDAAPQALSAARAHGTVRPVGVEQSNTSLRLDRTLVFKLFRKLDDGENPELEVSRFLTTRTTFRAMPLLRGSMTYESASGASSTVGVLQDWIENRGDGWGHVVALLRQSVADPVRETLLRDVFTLGVTTADFHAALAADPATPAFAPVSVTASDVEVWRTSFQGCASRAFALVEQSLSTWPKDARALGQALLDRRDRVGILADAPSLATTSAAFQKIRVHGDYHLGQTLKTADGFVLIDFEGEPTRSLAERRLKHCALKDVAGMMRSFEYAVATARNEWPDIGDDILPASRLRGSFLEGYLSAATQAGAVFLPTDRRVLDGWIDFFEAEKALYEIDYEINNRPAWVHIPLRGMLRILDGQV